MSLICIVNPTLLNIAIYLGITIEVNVIIEQRMEWLIIDNYSTMS